MKITSTFASKSTVIDISPQEFLKLSNPPRLIDVRSSFEYVMFHAPGAINLSLPRLLLARITWLRRWVLPEWFRDLSTDEPVAVICLTAHRSVIAAAQLAKAGWTQVYNISGGMMEWRRSGLKTIAGKHSS